MEKKFSSNDHCDYESYWNQLINFIDNNSDFSLEQSWDSLNYWDLGPSPERFKTDKEINSIFVSVIEEGNEKNLSLHDATYLKKNFLTKTLLSQINSSTDLIVEIGGGWGRNIFSLYMNLSKDYPNIDFIMGEVSTSGQNVCSSIIKNYNLPIISTYFNYYDWENIINIIQQKKYKNICVFSNHSIEQIPYLEYKMFNDFLNLDVDSLKFTHIEPVGFQIEGGNPQYTGASLYNQNLGSILLDLNEQNKIKLTNINPDYFAIGGWKNCGSLIQWERI
jgi:hypothetical protein